MQPDVIIVPIVFGVPALATTIVIRMVLRHRERMAALTKPPAASQALDTRLERVEQAIDAMAVEMERVGEGQRFLTRILSERQQVLGEGAEARRGRTATPH